jgi:hypothetical protein
VVDGNNNPVSPASVSINGQPLTADEADPAAGDTFVSLPGQATVRPLTPVVSGLAAYSATQQADLLAVQSLTVVSNSATQVDAADWAVVKSPTNDYVIVQANLSDTNAAALANAATAIQWTGGQPVPGNPFQCEVSKTNSIETTVTAALGGSSTNLNVWVIWASLTIKTNSTLDPDDKSAILVNGNWPTPATFNINLSGYNGLGGGNALGTINCATNSTLNYAYTIGKMEAKAILQPVGIVNLLNSTNYWDMRRTRQVIAWDNGGSPTVVDPQGGKDDTSQSFAKYLNSKNEDMFDLDTPGCGYSDAGTYIDHTAEVYENYYEYVTVNLGSGSEVCSTTNTYSYTAQVDVDATNTVRLNLLSTSLINLPTNSFYTSR